MKLLAPLVAALVASCMMVPPPAPNPAPNPVPAEVPTPAPPAISPEDAAQAARLVEEGRALWRRDGDLEGAAERFRAAVRLDPRGAYFFDYCRVLGELGSWDHALEVCREVPRHTDDAELLAQVELVIRELEKYRSATTPTTVEPAPPAVDPGAPIRAFACVDPQPGVIFRLLESCASNAGAHVLVQRRDPGDYRVRFDGLAARSGGAGGNVMVSAINPAEAACQVNEWKPFGKDLLVHVRCYDARGYEIDTRFSILVTFPPPIPDDRHVTQAYVRYQPGARPEDLAPFAFVPAGGTPSVTPQIRVGVYRVVLPGMAHPGGNVVVTATGRSPARCSVERWVIVGDDLAIGVHCTDVDGNAVDQGFALLATVPAVAGPDPSVSYLWIGDASVSTEPEARYVQNGRGGATTVRRSGLGDYRIVFRSLVHAVANVQAIAYSGFGTECHPSDWQATSHDLIVNLRCFRGGKPVDSRFALLVTGS